MQLHQFINSVGQVKLAEMLGVTKATLSNWQLYKNPPPPLDAFKLITLSHGALTWENIYDPYIDAQLRERKIDRKKVGPQLSFNF